MYTAPTQTVPILLIVVSVLFLYTPRASTPEVVQEEDPVELAPIPSLEALLKAVSSEKLALTDAPVWESAVAPQLSPSAYAILAKAEQALALPHFAPMAPGIPVCYRCH